ncbi:MAG: ATP-dependent helicase [Bifidobacteriaceae bacterium]|nr:ATP-dependent helicase [Bifidobacteriaceae bacterium]
MSVTADEILEGLDEQQRKAVVTLQGPVRIIAVAGAGKTRTITRRIAYACATGAWKQDLVLAVTFSVKAAAEMRSRLEQLGVENATVATFHSAALTQLRDVWEDVTDAPFPHVINDEVSCMSRALKRVEHVSFEPNTMSLQALLAEVSWCKVQLIAQEDYAQACKVDNRRPPLGLKPEEFAQIYTAYELEKTAGHEIDFNDILLMTCNVLEEYKDAAAKIRSKIGYVTVDEYQDVSPLQHRLMQLWLGSNTNICVVGDPAQTIYSFAGASSFYLLNFHEEFKNMQADIHLQTDYRSTAPIVAAANKVLKKSSQREDYIRLYANMKSGKSVEKTKYPDDISEARAIAKRIVQLRFSGEKTSNCAVLTRINSQQQVIAHALAEAGLQYIFRSDSSRRESAVGYNPNIDVALEKIGFSRDTGVNISTIHAAKGLEFKHVFIIGCSDGLIPYNATEDLEVLEEERRLLYVGITRAERFLYLSYAERKTSSDSFIRSASRFLL